MNKLTVLRNEASVGTHVTLRLTRGDDVSGRIAQLDDTHVSLDLDGKRVTIFAEILAGWELSPTSDDRNEGSDEPNEATSISHDTTYEGESEAADKLALARIDAQFSEAVKRAQLAQPEPDFQFPDGGFHPHEIDTIRQEWDRARNKYQYALKVKEPLRLSDLTKQFLAPLAINYPDSAAVRSLLGRILLKLDRRSEAMEHLFAAASLSETPDQWLALASAAADDIATECYALRRYFELTAPTNAKEAWFRYLAAANPIDLTGAGKVIDRWSSPRPGEDGEPDHLLSESLVHLLLSSGSPSLAQKAAANLVHNIGRLPTGWQDALDRANAPSDGLRAVERRLSQSPAPTGSVARPSRQPASPARAALPATRDQIQALQHRFQHGSEDLHHGRIKSFGNQRFGFIQEDAGDAVFFRIHDVDDEGLQEALLHGGWRTSGEVEFDVLPSPGHKYRHATRIVLTSTESLLQRARSHLASGQLAQAMGCVRRALQADPADGTARSLETEIRRGLQKQLREHATGLPKPTGPYARAKRAQLVEQDPEKAEKLLKQAIQEHDKKESAIKDLASLLHQHGRSHEAISLLTEYARQFKRDIAYDNMLATFYQHSDRHDEALGVLNRLFRSTVDPGKKNPLLKRIAYSYLRSSRYEDAEYTLKKLLSIDPQDRTAARWLASLEDARNTGAETEEIIGDLGNLSEEGVELSSLAHAAIDQCTYEGVDPKKLQAGTEHDKEARHVVELARNLGTRRPRDQAGYYLSAAALLKKHHSREQPRRIYEYLRNYFTSMAAASWIEKRPAEVVRTYYIESLGLVVENEHLDEAWRSLFQYLSTFSQGKNEVGASFWRRRHHDRQRYIGAIQRALEIMPEADTGWMEGLLMVGAQSSFARIALGEAMQTSQSLRSRFRDWRVDTVSEDEDIQQEWQSQCNEYARKYRRRLTACRTMTNYQASVVSMENLRRQIDGFFGNTQSRVDLKRLTSLTEIVEATLAFCRASDFEEKERNYWSVVNQADGFRRDVVDAPTQYSHEGLLPIAEHLKSLIEEEYAAMTQTSGAELSLRLLVSEYVRGESGELRLQIEVSNKSGCSPASSVRIELGPEASEYFVADHMEAEAVSTLRGGTTEVTQMIVRPREVAVKDRAFPIKASATYQDSLGETVQTAEHPWTVKLYSDGDFQHLDNPYAPYAEGGPVDEPDMFVGRDDLLSRLERTLLAGSASKSIVMFGQKRAGKSSLIEHLRRRLIRTVRVVCVPFSLQDIASDMSVTAFLHRILQSAADALEEVRFDGRDVPEFSPPSIEDMESRPTLMFHQVMTSLVRAMKRHTPHLRFVFLIDEFTDIFKEIKRGSIPPQFMKAWKAIIEKKYFASVLVGQDIMPAFKDQFPNEFGVTEDIRVTYLDDASAAALVEKPIGKKRFAGRAVRCLLDLTAGSPYYTMMFCARLVDYMNATRSMIVTEADIRTVEQEMLQGERRLTTDKFDNLLSAGDGIEDSGIDPEDTYFVCSEVARGAGKETWCSRHVIRASGEADIGYLLDDLEARDVVERKGDAYRLRVGLFKDWLLAMQG